MLVFYGLGICEKYPPIKHKSSEAFQEVNNWKEGQPISKDLFAYRRTTGCFLVDTDTQALYGKINNYPLLLAVIKNPMIDDNVFEYAVERTLLLVGPSRFFFDLYRIYLNTPGLLQLSRHKNLKKRMQYKHAFIDALFINEEDMPLKEAKEVFKQTQQELQNGIPWQEVYRKYADKYRYVEKEGINKGLTLTKIGNYGDFVISANKNNAKPFRNIEIPLNHILPLLFSKKGEVITLYAHSKKGLVQYSVRDVFQGINRRSGANLVERYIVMKESILYLLGMGGDAIR